jgi:nucleotide-binding universal stress UspA family protein
MARLGLTAEEVQGSVVDVALGTPAAGILRTLEEQQSELLVMCAYASRHDSERALGAIAAEVVANAPCPVVLVRREHGRQPFAIRRILLPYDGAPASAVAYGPAAGLARRASAELVVLHVAALGAQKPVEAGTFAAPRYVDQPQHEWPAWAHEFLAHLQALGHSHEDVRLRLYFASGDPGSEILRFLREQECDLVALACHCAAGHQALTANAVLRASPCPTVMVRAPEPMEAVRPAA